MGVAGFMILRIVRLYPLHVVAISIGGAIAIYSAHRGWSDLGLLHPTALLALGLLLVPELGSAYPFPFNIPTWSLFWEIVINAQYGAVARLLSNWLLCLIVCLGLLLIWANVATYGYFTTGIRSRDFWGGGARVCFSFFAGVALWRLHESRQRSPTAGVSSLVLMGTLLLILAVDPGEIYSNAFDVCVVVLAFPILIYAGASSTPRGVIGWICDFAGRASYGVYVLQLPVIELSKMFYFKVTHRQLADVGHFGIAAVCGLTIGLAIALDALYDVPVRRKLLAIFSKRTESCGRKPRSGRRS